MKGIAHLALSMAVTSLFAQAVQAGMAGNPLYFILGAFFGLLPDTLDCRAGRCLLRYNMEVQPDPLDPDPRQVAGAIADAVARADATRHPYRIKLNSIRLGPDSWQRYDVEFDLRRKRVTVTCGPPLDAGGKPQKGAALIGPSAAVGLPCGIKLDYTAQLTIDACNETLLEMQPTADGRVMPVFTAWQRRWSHSLVTGLLFAALAAAVWGPLAGIVGMLAYGAHLALDQLGEMGNNLFYPFRERRQRGLCLLNSGEMLTDIKVAWLACLLTFFSLSHTAAGQTAPLSLVKLLLWGALLPFGACRIARCLRRRRDGGAARHWTF